jgi:dihydrofolate reductase
VTISLIAACDYNNAIGNNNELLVKLPNDMKHFQKLTTNNFVCMGRKTYDSIGHPLKNRTNIILTRNKKYKAPLGTFVYHDIQEVIHDYQNQNNDENELFIIGGSEVYSQALQFANRIHLTIIEHTFPEVDSYFPKFNLVDFKPISCEKHEADENNPYTHYFVTYERRKLIENN